MLGLIPTRFFALLGSTIDPSVSVPSVAAASPIAAAMSLPSLEPEGLPSGTYGLDACPPRADNPEGTPAPRKFAHSERFALPRRIAPAARSFAATCASHGATEPRSTKEPVTLLLEIRLYLVEVGRSDLLSYSCLGHDAC